MENASAKARNRTNPGPRFEARQARRAAVVAGVTAGAVVVPVVAAVAAPAPNSVLFPGDGMPPPIEAAVKNSGDTPVKAPVEKPAKPLEKPVTTQIEMSSIETTPPPAKAEVKVAETALPHTGANPVVAALGAGFLVGGAVLRRGFRDQT